MKQFRVYICELLLRLMVNIAPADTKDGRRILEFARDYAKEIIKENFPHAI
jgi:hypothetical protein